MNSIVPFNNSQLPYIGGGLPSLIEQIYKMIYGHRIIEAQVTFSKLDIEYKEVCIQALTEIAKATTDDNIRLQMFQSIWMLTVKTS